ncbi:MAG: heme NO-binding domain-containing protein [Planctomycetes bacterium]|nr:heme NO-binding domain-containing protein [Planctomycetota bacterium]
MKGVIFCEFIELVESTFGLEVVDDILRIAAPANGGAYTRVGTYDHADLVDMSVALSGRVQIPLAELLETFGRALYSRLADSRPDLTADTTVIDILERLDGVIHADVRKLYPEAELPRFDCRRIGEDTFRIEYRSDRPFARVAYGLILGCGERLAQRLVVEIVSESGDGTAACFTVTVLDEVQV